MLPKSMGGTQEESILNLNKGPWNPEGLELFGSKADIQKKNDQRKNEAIIINKDNIDTQFERLGLNE